MVEADASDDGVLTTEASEGFFHLARLGVGAVEDGGALVGVIAEVLLEEVRDEQSFGLGVRALVEEDLLALGAVRPQLLPLARLIVGDDVAGGLEDALG